MLCDKCKRNSAKVYFKKTENNKEVEYFLCRECAKTERGGCFLTNITSSVKADETEMLVLHRCEK